MQLSSVESSARDAWFAAATGVVAGGVTALLGPTQPSDGAAEVTRIGASMHAEPLVLAALVVGVVSVGRRVDTETAAVWTTLGAAPAVWWLVVAENTAVVFGAESTPQLALWSVGLGFALVASLGLTLLVTLVGVLVGAWMRRHGNSFAERVPVG
ncbi:MAG: hypothetical protein J07HB67_01647 [halophilic archaeon J07HB67]|jgi:hypothetical protein|nr:MAG: hypothetical protein J07HB67_01647 [halophilic archaeon J07HB67]